MIAAMPERCLDPELMDDTGLSGPEVELALREIAVVNRYLGGVATTLAGLAPRLRGRAGPLRLLDVGTGGGDLPVAIAELGRRLGVPLAIVAVDRGADACRRARAAARSYPEITVVRADVFALPFPGRSFHLAHCAMFLHHFTQEESARILAALGALVREGIVVNDLHRHPFAYHAIRVLTRLLSRSRLVKFDAPLSVRRAFRAADLDDLRARCAFPRFRYRWRWAFRYLCEIDVSGEGRTA
jgi:SAM-dependent methyltransferase